MSTLYKTNNKHPEGVCSFLWLQRQNCIARTCSHVYTEDDYLYHHMTSTSMVESAFWLLREKKTKNFSNPVLQRGITGQSVSSKRHRWSAVGMMGKWDRYQQPCEGAIDKVDEQSAWGDVTGRSHKINRTGIKQGHLQHLHVSKKVPTSHHYG